MAKKYSSKKDSKLLTETLSSKRSTSAKGFKTSDSASSFQSRFAERKEAAIPFKILESLMNKGKRSICRVLIKNKIQGSAGLIVAQHNNRLYYMLITCNHVLPFTARFDLCQVEMHFQGLEKAELHNKLLREEWIQFSWTSIFYDATVIELTEETVEFLRDNGADFLVASSKEVKREEKIGLVQYPATREYPEGELSFSNGEVYDIQDINLYYWVEGAEGSSGSPVLSYDGSALAVHNRQILRGPNNFGSKETRGGALLTEILHKYFKDKDFFSR